MVIQESPCAVAHVQSGPGMENSWHEISLFGFLIAEDVCAKYASEHCRRPEIWIAEAEKTDALMEIFGQAILKESLSCNCS